MAEGIRILIVEDENIVALDLRKSLEELGYRIVGTASCGQEAIDLDNEHSPDLILMDIRLKGEMDGIAAARIIQASHDIPIVYLTAYTDNQTLKQATLTGPSAYLVKPVESQELKTTIEVALFKHQMERELKESREHFREIFEQNFDAIVLFKRGSFQVTDINPQAQSLFQYSRQDLMDRFSRVFPEEEFYRLFKEEITGFKYSQGNNFFVDRCRLKRKDNADIICSIKANLIFIRQTEVLYCSFRDITEKVRMERETQYLQSQLIHTNKMTSLGTLASGIAHEINNPNNYIMSNTQIIQQVWEDLETILEDYHKGSGDFSLGGLEYSEVKDIIPQLLQATVDGSRRIKAIINNLREFSRPKGSSLDDDVDVNKVLQFSVSILGHLIKKYTDHFHTDPGKDLPLIKGNPQQIEQVFINLIQNALQALPDRDRGVSVSTSFNAAEQMVVLTVKDQGVGMNKAVRLRIMDPFFTTKQEKGGSGLGLYISYSIIKAHRGGLEFTSKPGRGTTAVTKFPIPPGEAS